MAAAWRPKRGGNVGRGKDGKGTTLMLIVETNGRPMSAHMEAVNRHERTQVQDTLVSIFTDAVPPRLIGDKGYDSDPLDADLADQQIAMMAPHRRNRKRKTAAPDEAALESRAGICLAAELSPPGGAL